MPACRWAEDPPEKTCSGHGRLTVGAASLSAKACRGASQRRPTSLPPAGCCVFANFDAGEQPKHDLISENCFQVYRRPEVHSRTGTTSGSIAPPSANPMPPGSQKFAQGVLEEAYATLGATQAKRCCTCQYPPSLPRYRASLCVAESKQNPTVLGGPETSAFRRFQLYWEFVICRAAVHSAAWCTYNRLHNQSHALNPRESIKISLFDSSSTIVHLALQ